MSESERVLVEVTLPAPVDDVWRALRDPAEIRRWFGWEYGDDDPTDAGASTGLDAEIHSIFVDMAEAAQDERSLTWDQGDRFTLEPDGQRTILRVTRAAPAGDASRDEVYDDISEGWITFVQHLRFALDRHRGEDRRTVYLDGRAADVDGFPVEAALELTDVAALSPGSPYDTTAATGDRLTGQVWFRTAHQFGITVEQFGDGLLVIGDQPPATHPPHGGGWILISAYGMDDAAFDELHRRWARWWRERYRPAGDGGEHGDQ